MKFLVPLDPSNLTIGVLFLPLKQGCSPIQNLLNSLRIFFGSVPNGLNTIANSLFYFFKLIIVL